MSAELVNKLAIALGSGASQELLSLIQGMVSQRGGSQLITAPVAILLPASVNRVDYRQGSRHDSGGADYVLSSGWGTGASLTPNTGTNDVRGQLAIYAGTAAFSANPTITLTFRDGAWPVAPFAVACRGTLPDQPTVQVTVVTTTTTMTITFQGTPQAGEIYLIGFFMAG